jgi:hypothetical protein
MANDLDDLDEAESGPPAGAGPLIIVDLRHPIMMPPPWPGHRAAELAGAPRPDSSI